MKLRNILLAGVAVTGLITTSCNDYLDVDSPSVFDYDYVYSTTYDMNLALNGVYSKLMSPYSSLLVNNLILNSDIDFATNTGDSYGSGNTKRFDSTAESSDASNLWKQGYNGIEYCNMFINGVEKSPLYDEDDEDIMQMLGEGYCIRAILYHEMVWYFGDIPYSRVPATKAENVVFPVVDRHTILDDMIADLEAIAPKMKPTAELSDGVERIGQELAYALIARLSLTAGGYTLEADKSNPKSVGTMKRPDNYLDYYKKAEKYAKMVMDMGSHSLGKPYYQVFVDECNYKVDNNDDPIFEIPFAKDNTGNIGYIHGPKINNNESKSELSWGYTSGSVKLHGLAPYLFDKEDIRRQYLFGTWNYTYKGEPEFENNAYLLYNCKWSKLWATTGLGNTTAGNTGINYPYMRYADVLLMYAEAANEVNNGPTAEAKNALRQVRERAFRTSPNSADKVDAYIAQATSKEEFLKAVLDERKFEFAGENMRWKDLVRNNIYGQELYYTYLRNSVIADNKQSSSDLYMDELCQHDGLGDYFYQNDIMSGTAYYRIVTDTVLPTFPNTQIKFIDVFKLWEACNVNDVDKKVYDKSLDLYTKHRSDDGVPSGEVCYSLLGYIYRDRNTEEEYISNGLKTGIMTNDYTVLSGTPTSFPPVRYILPYPSAAIRDGAGAYVNYYGY
ncbi:MAG: RagB/SusD family nutrient uptake outer membrane protein [Bacteroides sp.]|nr:RagB/SusD family nutrient uptake outer membrane protein [Bacteroides sp.]